jgi:hypothetical protein
MVRKSRRFWNVCWSLSPAMLLAAGMVVATSHFDAAYAWDVTTHGNNGWGNGGNDGTNPGSDNGKGVAQGGPGAGTGQADSKSADTGR